MLSGPWGGWSAIVGIMAKASFVVLILLTAVSTNLPAQPSQKAPATTKIVFVCEHGSAKSVIAAAHCRRLAQERGLNLEIVSRGSTPDAEIPPGVRNGLKADGIDVGTLKPAPVTWSDLQGASKIISFGPDLSSLAGGKPVEDWSATPAVSTDYQAARSYIVKRIQQLLDQVAKAGR